MLIEFKFQIAAISKSKDIESVSEVIRKLYNGEYKEHPALYELLKRNDLDHAVQLVSIILKELHAVPNTIDTIPFRNIVGLRILQDLMKVS